MTKILKQLSAWGKKICRGGGGGEGLTERNLMHCLQHPSISASFLVRLVIELNGSRSRSFRLTFQLI